jgi:pimeloyl-ACP methyl ester carboxylesterase
MMKTRFNANGGLITVETVDARLPWAPNETIVFHHGLGACGAVWRGWLPTLVNRYRLVTYDMRGHGDTPVPPGFEWSIDALVRDLVAVADRETSGQFHLVGESIGGTAALAFAARYPNRLLSLTVSNGTHIGGTIENLEPWREIITTDGMAAWSKHMMDQRFYYHALSADKRTWYQAQQASADADAILAGAEALVGVDLTSQLARINIPTLLLHPDNSPFIPVPVMADLHARLPRAQLNVFAGSRHGLPFSHSEACSGVLRRFLSELD